MNGCIEAGRDSSDKAELKRNVSLDIDELSIGFVRACGILEARWWTSSDAIDTQASG